MVKQIFSGVSGFIVAIGLMTLGCATDDTVIVDSSNIQDVTEAAKRGTWYISNYNDSGKDETNDYAGYDFVFDDGGVLTATNGVTTVTGSWSITVDSSDDDNELDFNIAFTAPAKFEELSDDWDIQVTNSDKIELIDVSGGSGEIDALTFSKN